MLTATHVVCEKNKSETSSLVFAENGLFVFGSFSYHVEEKKKKELTKEIEEKIGSADFAHLSAFDHALHDWISQSTLPTDFSLAVLYERNGIVYLFTKGDACICLVRNQHKHVLIHGSKSASGYVKASDRFILSDTSSIHTLSQFSGSDLLVSPVLHEQTQEFLNKENLFASFVAVNFTSDSSSVIEPVAKTIQSETIASVTKVEPAIFRRFKTVYADLRLRSEQAGKKKKLTFIATIAVLGVLIWSVGFGVQRRNAELQQKKLDETKTMVTKFIEQAEQSSISNTPEAIKFLSEADTQISNLRKTLSVTYSKQVDGLQASVDDARGKITRKEEKSYDEIFDFTVDNKNAYGDTMAIDGSTIAVLDKKNAGLYLFSLDKKSLETFQDPVIKKASLITLSGDEIYFLVPGQGIYSETSNKINKIVENDKKWTRPEALDSYNGNIYLLDSKANDIIKYVPIDSGYSEGSSYFDGSAPDLSLSTSMSIDGSVYIGDGSLVLKYTGGVQDGFTSSFPNDSIHVSKVITNKELQKVYIWDKEARSFFVLDKDGSYVKQIQSSVFKIANDVVVFGDSIYVLTGQKLYAVKIN